MNYKLTQGSFILKDASDICPHCFAHSGFLDSWRGGRKPIIDFWKAVRDAYPGYKTVATGHSLGGALATLCALELKKLVPAASVSLYTYGIPRVGDQTFATFIESSLGSNSYRVTHLNDPVPRLPGRLFGFRHPYPEYHITSPHIPHVLSANESVLMAPANLVVTPADVLVLDRTQSDEGNVGYSCSDIDMHDSYFMDISSCVAGDSTPLLGGASFTPGAACVLPMLKLTLF
jgi:pimeloyl-ACP methyl ester carboxylesterase